MRYLVYNVRYSVAAVTFFAVTITLHFSIRTTFVYDTKYSLQDVIKKV